MTEVADDSALNSRVTELSEQIKQLLIMRPCAAATRLHLPIPVMHNADAEFLAAGGNEHPSAADVDPDSGLIAYAAGQNIALWRVRRDGDTDASRGVEALLPGHNASVTAVKFLHARDGGASLLVSGAADGSIRVWRHEPRSKLHAAYVCIKTLESHTRSINALAVLGVENLFVSAAADASFKVWRMAVKADAVDLELLQTVQTKPTLIPLAVALAQQPASSALVLAVAGSSPKVQIYSSDEAGSDFRLAATHSGHEGWIRSLDFVEDVDAATGTPSLLLASASQDKYIRLWRVQQGREAEAGASKFDALATTIGGSMSNRAQRFRTAGVGYAVTFEALLVGHEDWIFNARWLRDEHGLKLLSASADNSLSIWEPERSSGVWTCTVRLGEISVQKGATTATGSTGGFWLGLWYDGGHAVLSLGKTGGWRIWRHHNGDDSWIPDAAVSGHTRAVNGIAWSLDGSYLLSTSEDKTTRLFAPTRNGGSWHEFSRPQIHGYDLNCIDTISMTRFISGADEKLLRVFDIPKAVSEHLFHACGIDHLLHGSTVEAANMPVLGLSNKAFEAPLDEAIANETAAEPVTNGYHAREPQNTDSAPPTEDALSRSLLWPEIEKLYGHGYEISAVGVSSSGTLVATACKASSTTHAAIRIYRTDDWRLAQPPLEAHSLTVTRLRFSTDDRHLLSVSRDRQVAIFERAESEEEKREGKTYYRLMHGMPQKAHSRMVLDVTGVGPNTIATAGRDKNVHIWRIADGPSPSLTKATSIQASGSVTAIDAQTSAREGKSTIAYGLDDGSIFVVDVDMQTLAVLGEPRKVPYGLAPSKAVTQLCWRPGDYRDAPGTFLAVASEDCSVRLLRLPRMVAAPET